MKLIQDWRKAYRLFSVQAMGLSTTQFGNPKFCTDGPIAEIAA